MNYNENIIKYLPNKSVFTAPLIKNEIHSDSNSDDLTFRTPRPLHTVKRADKPRA